MCLGIYATCTMFDVAYMSAQAPDLGSQPCARKEKVLGKNDTFSEFIKNVYL